MGFLVKVERDEKKPKNSLVSGALLQHVEKTRFNNPFWLTCNSNVTVKFPFLSQALLILVCLPSVFK